MDVAQQLIILGGVSSASGGGPTIPSNALYDDDGVTPLLDDDGSTYLTEN